MTQRNADVEENRRMRFHPNSLLSGAHHAPADLRCDLRHSVESVGVRRNASGMRVIFEPLPRTGHTRKSTSKEARNELVGAPLNWNQVGWDGLGLGRNPTHALEPSPLGYAGHQRKPFQLEALQLRRSFCDPSRPQRRAVFSIDVLEHCAKRSNLGSVLQLWGPTYKCTRLQIQSILDPTLHLL